MLAFAAYMALEFARRVAASDVWKLATLKGIKELLAEPSFVATTNASRCGSSPSGRCRWARPARALDGALAHLVSAKRFGPLQSRRTRIAAGRRWRWRCPASQAV